MAGAAVSGAIDSGGTEMNRLARRSAMASFLGVCAAITVPSTVRALARPPLSIPTRPMRLTRIIERELRDGERLVVSREWQVVFSRQGRGLSINGEQIGAQVEAPAKLEPLAEIERTRSTEGMFPIMLDSSGMIMAAGDAIEQDDLDAAIRNAQSLILQTSVNANKRAERLAFLGQLQNAGGNVLQQMPRDLFFPRGEPVRTLRPLDLPGGATGEFEFTYIAQPAQDAAWLAQAERRIITRIGDDERQSAEVWTLA